MPIAVGERFVRRHDAARSSTSNTTAADIAYDTAVLSEGDYVWSSPEVTVDEAGFYLTLWDIGEVQLGGSTRAVGTLIPSINTVDQTIYKARHRYLRNSGGNHNACNGNAILNLSASDDVKVRNPGTIDNTDSLGNYATNVNQGGGLQLIRLHAGNFTEVQRTTNQALTVTFANATRPWLDSTPTLTQITFTSEVQDDDGLYSGSGGDITLAANKKYLIVYGGTFNGSSSQRHVHGLVLDIDGTNRQYSTGYERNNSSDGPPMQGMYLHEVGGTAEIARLYGFVEQEDAGVANTVNATDVFFQIFELPDSAEWIHVDNGTTDSLTTALASTSTYYDTPLSSTVRSDGNSNLSLDAANDAVQNDSGGSLPVLAIGWHKWDRDGGASGTRKHCWAYWDNGGTRLAYGISGGYNRGQQGNDDTFQLAYVGAATMDLANAADLSFVVRDPVSGANSDMGIYASDHRHFLGVQVLDLNTIVPASDPTVTDVETDEDFRDLDTGVTITGTNFEAVQGTGTVEIGNNSDYATATKVAQTVTSWGDTSIDFTAVLGALTPGPLFLFVTNDSGNRNDPGFSVTVHRAVAIQLRASANVAASGEDTTAQLTAPATKSTGDFTTGRMWDDENGVDNLNIAVDEYTEVEWSLETTGNAAIGQDYEFRVLYEDAVLDSYTVTPEISIVAAGGNPKNPIGHPLKGPFGGPIG